MSRGQFLLLALLLAQSLFLLAPQYGFYEDDYALVVPFFQKDAHQLMAEIRFDITVWPTGRPLNHTLPALCGALYPWEGRLAIFDSMGQCRTGGHLGAKISFPRRGFLGQLCLYCISG